MSDKDWTESVRSIKKAIIAEQYQEAFISLQTISSYSDDFIKQTKYSSLFFAIPLDVLDLKPLRVAVLATSTVSHFINSLKFWLAKEGFAAEIFETEFDTIHQTILNPDSELYSFNPDLTILFTNYRDIKINSEPGASVDRINECIQSAVDEYVSLWEAIKEHSNSYILQNNADLPDFRVFGNYDGNVHWSLTNMLQLFNLELAQAADSGVTILDFDYVSSNYGKHEWHDNRYWYHSKHFFSLDATGLVAFEYARLIGAVKGVSKKCIVLDLDNTLWGGVIADDGIEGIVLGDTVDGEAFVDFQKYLCTLKNRGVLLTVCSKNDENNAKEPFLNHPDMVLKLDDISVFVANWNDKASNIREIAETLNIGLDSVVFIDDNPAERALVKSFLPMVEVPDLHEDPTEYIRIIDSGHYFETISFSDEDKSRSKYYQNNTSRKNLEKKFTNLSDFLINLKMVGRAGSFDSFNLPRIVQLINKSNQFNLTTIRYSENDIISFTNDKNYFGRYYYLNDVFGENGLISVVILEKQPDDVLYIDTWVMSCRVLSRGMEEFIADDIIAIAQDLGCTTIRGRYIPTKKNNLVKELYKRLNYNLISNNDGTTEWDLNVIDNQPCYDFYIVKEEINS